MPDADQLGFRVDEVELHELPDDLTDIPTDELLAYLGVIGPEAVSIQQLADEAKAVRLRLFLELEGREVSYRAMARQATGVSSTAILKALRRHHTAAEPVA